MGTLYGKFGDVIQEAGDAALQTARKRRSVVETQETDADPEHNVSPRKERSIEMFDRLFTMPKFGHDWR